MTGKRLKISDYVGWQLIEIRRECNFTPEEMKFFNLSAQDKSIIEMARLGHWSESKCNALSRAVKRKIFEVYPTGKPQKAGS